MKILHLILCICLNLTFAQAQTPSDGYQRNRQSLNQDGKAQLQLTTKIIKQHYEGSFAFLRWTLELTYTNMGNQTILLDKNSSLIYRSTVSRNLKAAASKKYEAETRSSFISVSSMKAAGFRFGSVPEVDAFVTLRQGESYSLETIYGARVYDGTKDNEDYLRPGNHFLQVRVATWYYFNEPGVYRERWGNRGYLWSQDVTSLPMQFTVEKKQVVSQSR